MKLQNAMDMGMSLSIDDPVAKEMGVCLNASPKPNPYMISILGSKSIDTLRGVQGSI